MSKCCDVKIGELRWTVTIESNYAAPDGAGGYLKAAWSTVLTAKSKYEPKNGRERVHAESIDAPTDALFTIRKPASWDPAVWNKYRLVFQGRNFNIKYTREVGTHLRFLEIAATENVPN